jgi:hypothetical protein
MAAAHHVELAPAPCGDVVARFRTPDPDDDRRSLTSSLLERRRQ